MAERPVAEITGDLHSLYFEGMEKTHPKILNPHSFPLPRPGHLILSGNVYKEGHQNKSIKQRFVQLAVSADDRAELRYAEIVAAGRGPVRWKNVVNISRGLGVQFEKTKNARGDFAHCLRIDLPMVTGAAPVPAYKLVLCFRDVKDRELWREALVWAEKRHIIVQQHDEHTRADKQAAELELQEQEHREAEHREQLLAKLADAQLAAEQSRKRQEELLAAKEALLAQSDQLKRAGAGDGLRPQQERGEP